jgi:hypothetical protein
MSKEENDLVLLEMGSRIQRLEELVAEMSMTLLLIVPCVRTLQEAEYARWKDGTNG